MALFTGKRGVSPLVATVLLIAFAVALGAVVMQFGEAAVVGVCGTNIVLKPIACMAGSADQGNIKFTVQNKGSDEIASIKVEAKGATSTNQKPFDLKIPVNSAREGSLPYSSTFFGALQNVKFTPVVGQTVCDGNAIDLSSLSPC